MAKKQPTPKSVEALKHEATRKNIPTAEYESLVQAREKTPIQVAYERRNRDLDPQLVWRGKDEQDWSDLVVSAAPLYIQEKVHPKALIDDLLRETREREHAAGQVMPDLFSDFNGIPKGADKTEFYQHDQNWSNRMILGDSLQVMASLAEREGLRGKVQCIYIDPPYGIKFNSNFQWSTTSRDVRDGNVTHITREPEQVKAFRDTWRDGINSYLTYLRDRLTAARDLLTESGSVFVQIGDENVHLIRSILDEVLGSSNFVSLITVQKMAGLSAEFLNGAADYVLWYAKNRATMKYRQLFRDKVLGVGHGSGARYDQLLSAVGEKRAAPKEAVQLNELLAAGWKPFQLTTLSTFGSGGSSFFQFDYEGKTYWPSTGKGWLTTKAGMAVLSRAGRVASPGRSVRYVRMLHDFPSYELNNVWTDIASPPDVVYVVQTSTRLSQRCILMATDPGDLVLDPTCGSGTTATVAEQWGRRWITIDTSRVALALARARIMGARYPFYLLADTRAGQLKEADVTHSVPSTAQVYGDIRQGFVYERVPHITLKSIANNAEIDVIWEKWQAKLEPLREALNTALNESWQEWQVPREAAPRWPAAAAKAHEAWLQMRLERQKDIDASIAAKAEFEYLYDKPYEDRKIARVAGPFTVESLSPHRVLGVDENDELIDPFSARPREQNAEQTFAEMILDNLKTAGVQQAHKDDKITFTSLTPWPGEMICADGRYIEGESDSDKERRSAIFIGPEFGTVTRPDLVQAAREAADAGFDVLIACAFSYEGYATEFDRLGSLPVLKARMNADLHMAENLKNTGKGNLFVIFGEPDIVVISEPDDKIRVKINGVDVFHPNSGEVRSDGPDGIACWFIDTDYNEESFFVRHAYFLGANDPYDSLRTTLKAEIDEEAWTSLNSDMSRPFPKPRSGRIAVKVINHLGDEVMKVFRTGK